MGTPSTPHPGSPEEPLQLAELIERVDLDGLTARIDSLSYDDQWAEVVDLRDRCRAALSRGKQLWPAAAYAEYRMALDAPAAISASVLDSPADRFTFGPFAEVMASTHTFAQLSAHLPVAPSASMVVQERVCRGEDLRADDVARSQPDVLGLPLALELWEPIYPVATYAPSRLEAHTPTVPPYAVVAGGCADWRSFEDRAATEALRDLAHTWTTASNGRAHAIAVEGDAVGAVLALGVPCARLASISGAEALAWMCWTAASGGANGRRRGSAAGRHAAWWALTAIAGLADVPGDEPATADELGDALRDLRWFLWDDGAPATGWALRLAVEDPVEGLAWSLRASDARLQ